MNEISNKIDVWCNLFTELGIRGLFLENKEVMFSMGTQWGRTGNMKWYSAEEFLEKMDQLGIEKVCIPAINLANFRTRDMACVFPYEVVAELTQKWPDRFVGLAGLNPFDRMEGVRRLERAVREYGFKGAHVHPFGFDRAINHRDWYPFYAKCEELGVPVVFQVGHSAEFLPSEHGRPIYLDDIALYFENLNLIGGHTGWPWSEELIAMAWKHPNVYIAVSGHAPKYWDPKLIKFLNSRGMGKVMWGTDYPLIMHKESIDQIAALNLKPEAVKALYHDAAAKVFKF